MTVAELLHRMSSQELSEWIAYLTLEAEEIESARTGRQPGRAASSRRRPPTYERLETKLDRFWPPLPSPEELRRKLERAVPVKD
jgi:hypothetical protein